MTPEYTRALLDVQDLTVIREGRTILHGLAFGVAPGSFVGLIGPNGSGKTTLLRTLVGLQPFTGSIRLDGRPLAAWSAAARARRLAYVRQQARLDLAFTVRTFVGLGRAAWRGWFAPLDRDDHSRVEAALEALDLTDLAERPLYALSGGEQQRVHLAQALAQDAPLLLLDEPTAHLDIHHQYDLLYRVADLARAGRTVVAALHDLELAARLADQLLVLDRGHLVAHGPPGEVLHPERLAATFRMAARVETGAEGALWIRYLGPT